MKRSNPRWTAGTMWLIAAVLGTAAGVLADEKSEVPYPEGFRSWQHVKSIVIGPEHKSFANRGGIHHYYANEKAMEGYRTGKFPNGSVIVDEGVFTKDGEGDAKGILLEGDRRALDVMAKNDSFYKETGGWGFEHFDRNDKTGSLMAGARAQCGACHSRAKDGGYVYSMVRR